RYLQVDVDDETASSDAFVPIANADLDRERKRVIVKGAPTALPQFSSMDGTRVDVSRGAEGDRTLTRAEEEVRTAKRAVSTGEVRVGKRIETKHRHEDVTVSRD